MNHRTNLTILALLIIVLALGGYYFSPLFFATVYLGIGFSFYFLYVLVRHPLNITVFDFFNVAIVTGFLLGPGFVVLKSTPELRREGLLAVGPFAYTGYQQSWCIAYATIAGAFLVLHLAGSKAIKGRMRDHLESLQALRIVTPTDYAFLSIMTLIIAYAFHTGALGFDGIQPLAINLAPGAFVRTTAIGEVTGHALPALIPTIVAMIIIEKNLKRRIYLGLLLLANFSFLITTGRRQVYFAVLVTITLYFILDERAVRALSFKNLKSNFKFIIVLALIGCLVTATSIGFYALRVAGWQFGREADAVPLAARIAVGIHIIENPQETDFYEKTKTEGATRPATLLGYIAALENARMQQHLGGRCMLQNILFDIPTGLWPDKNHYVNDIIPCGDDDVNIRFGLPLLDSPGTPESYGYADFGLIGLLTYPLICATYCALLLNLFMRKRLASFKIFTLSAVAFYTTFAEGTMTTYFDCFRAVVIIFLCVVGFELLVFGAERNLAKKNLRTVPITPLPR